LVGSLIIVSDGAIVMFKFSNTIQEFGDSRFRAKVTVETFEKT